MNKQMVVNTCPVCGMNVEYDDWTETHTGIQYLFCSSQCRDNFRERPLLYTGKNAGNVHVRLMQRRFRLESSLDSSQAEIVRGELCAMMGVEQIEVEGDQISLTYDLLQCTVGQVEECLKQAGVRLGEGWSDRLKRGWMKYKEENELDNLVTQPGACCNRPPGKG